MKSNFEFLSLYWPDIAQIGAAAESYLYTDPNACIIKLGMAAERITSEALRIENITLAEESAQVNRIKVLDREGLLPQNINNILFALRKARNDAVHNGTGSMDKAKTLLRMTYNLCCWFMEVYGDWTFQAEQYREPVDESQDADFALRLKEQEERLTELAEQVAQIKTAASDTTRDERVKKSEAVSDALDLSDPEEDYLLSEQVRLEVNILPVVNYALQQNGVPIVRSVSVVNNSTEKLEDVEVQISIQPELCLPLTKHIEYVPAESTFEINDIQLTLNGDLLAGLTEKLTGTFRITLVSDGNLLYTEESEITALAYDQWHGSTFYPELLCAFVMPNHPEIVKITARAAELLGQWTGDPSLDAYQSKDVNRVLKQAAAVYGALQEQNIVYSVPPASFEVVGQRVRLCDTVMQQKMGTCLDLTLLYASALEAIGLHPLLVLKKGHIFAGVWLEDLSFSESVQDDASLVTKRLAEGINEIAVVECTALVAGRNISFDQACSVAEQQMAGEGAVEYIIDVNRSRLSGVRPIPMRVHTDDGWHIERPELDESDLTQAPKAISGALEIEEFQETPATRKMRWEKKLLDLGLRNTLINLRLSKSMIPILASSIDELENALSNGEDFSVLPRPADWHISGGLSFDTMHELGDFSAVIQSEFKNHRLRAVLTETELEKTIKNLYRSAKTALEENGANTLYLALGLLRWYENPRSTKARYAPMILIPIEMVRKSAAQGYVIRLRDDDPQMNITMLEKLRQDFQITVSGLDPLPQDEQGIDTRRVFTIMRKAVMGQKNWDVLESAYLGIFSFSQFVMWNDIRNRSEDLAKNKIVRSLMDGKLAWDASEMEIGDRVSEDDVFLPLPADASQLYAIEAANRGESFVLHGPPGTGKSQTITALIANALAQGKTVLFVAEKMAALEVVQRRLDSIGIGTFCLELHSNKSKKKDVLEQLRKATEVTKNQSAEAYAAKAAQIAGIRQELDDYAIALHEKQSYGLSLYELINEYEANKDAIDLPDFAPDVIYGMTSEKLDAQMVLVQRIIAAAKAVGHPQNHPLSAVGCTVYTQRLRMDVPRLINEYKRTLEALRPAWDSFADAVHGLGSSYQQLEKATKLAGEMQLWFSFPATWVDVENIDTYASQLQIMCEYYLQAAKKRAALSETWKPDFFSLDGEALLAEYRSISAKWLLPRASGMKALTKRLSAYAQASVDKDDIEPALTKLIEYQKTLTDADRLFGEYGKGLGECFKGEHTDWNDILKRCEEAKNSAARLEDLWGDDSFRKAYCGKKQLQNVVTAFMVAWNEMLPAKASLYETLDIEESPEEPWLEGQIELCDRVLAHTDEMREWIAWNSISEEALQEGLLSVISAYRNGMPHEEVQSAYKKSISQALAMRVIDSVPALNQFSGAVFNEKIEQFKRMDGELTRLTRQEIFCRLASNVPNFAREAARSSELGILQRAIRSGGRGLSIRKLFEQIPNMLPRLCPCMLMSPISAAQYLDPHREPFDIVVFDEASQLPTCKAVGALARGRNAVIVGDPKQMPPTSFFATNAVDEENIETEDLESILDDCLALNMPQTHLLWHYRSRHESLIAFSNHQFYENKLYTFPSVNDREKKVSLVHVDGVFDRGKTRQNRAEAEAVVAELKRRCHDPKEAGYSVGVVTFNIHQQNLIDDLLTEACQDDEKLEAWAYESEEPVFIKNLENVQGDERDVILFSVGYGPDSTGKVSMNFGPLNREGGWRRLNVAVSRARCEMKVFSTLLPEQIDMARTSADGVAALRAFLEYAAGQALVENSFSLHGRSAEVSGIADAICSALQQQGYATEQMVGHSEYRIDVGVVDPRNPETYILGILLDGGSYGTSKTTRDREIAQISVLEGLGWHLLRVWSMDWWDNSKKELKRIFDELDALKNNDTPSEKDTVFGVPMTTPAVAPPEEEVIRPQREMVADVVPMPDRTETSAKVYSATWLADGYLSPDDFLHPYYVGTIRKSILKVLQTEAPVSEGVLIRRVVQSYGIARSGSRIQGHMTALLSSMRLRTTTQGDQKIYWNVDQDPKTYTGFRASGDGDNRRDAKDVPVEEAANAVCYVLYDQVSMSHDDLVRESANLLNYTRMGSNVVAIFGAAIRYAQREGKICEENNGLWRLTASGMEYAKELAKEITTIID